MQTENSLQSKVSANTKDHWYENDFNANKLAVKKVGKSKLELSHDQKMKVIRNANAILVKK